MASEIGKEKCMKLRSIRERIAWENDIPYEPGKCDNDGPCAGTCPACDREEDYIDRYLREMVDQGKEVKLVGICADAVKFTLNEDGFANTTEYREEVIKWERQRENTRYAILSAQE